MLYELSELVAYTGALALFLWGGDGDRVSAFFRLNESRKVTEG